MLQVLSDDCTFWLGSEGQGTGQDDDDIYVTANNMDKLDNMGMDSIDDTYVTACINITGCFFLTGTPLRI